MRRNRRIQSVRPGLLVCDSHRLSTFQRQYCFPGSTAALYKYIVNCYTSSYYVILLYCSMLQHVAASYSIHSPSPDLLIFSPYHGVSGSRLQSSVRSISVKPWPGHLATNVTSAWDQCLCLIQTWRNLNLIQYLYRFFTYLHISLQILHNFYTCIGTLLQYYVAADGLCICVALTPGE